MGASWVDIAEAAKYSFNFEISQDKNCLRKRQQEMNEQCRLLGLDAEGVRNLPAHRFKDFKL